MKAQITATFFISLIFTLASCGGGGGGSSDDDGSNSSTLPHPFIGLWAQEEGAPYSEYLAINTEGESYYYTLSRNVLAFNDVELACTREQEPPYDIPGISELEFLDIIYEVYEDRLRSKGSSDPYGSHVRVNPSALPDHCPALVGDLRGSVSGTWPPTSTSLFFNQSTTGTFTTNNDTYWFKYSYSDLDTAKKAYFRFDWADGPFSYDRDHSISLFYTDEHKEIQLNEFYPSRKRSGYISDASYDETYKYSPDNGGGILEYIAANGEGFYVKLHNERSPSTKYTGDFYFYAVADDHADNFGRILEGHSNESVSSTCSASGKIQYVGDKDIVKVNCTSGTYQVNLTSPSGYNENTLSVLVMADNGASYISSNPDIVQLTAPTDFYVSVRSSTLDDTVFFDGGTALVIDWQVSLTLVPPS